MASPLCPLGNGGSLGDSRPCWHAMRKPRLALAPPRPTIASACSRRALKVIAFLAACGVVRQCVGYQPPEGEALKRLEKEELQFAEGSLKREMEEARLRGGDAENAIRRAYRKIALRYRKNIFEDSKKFDFQMRILNLARDALMRGDTFTSSSGEEEQEPVEPGSGRELPSGHRMSEDILKSIFSWQEYALEEGVRFDDPAAKYFVGHTQHAFREAVTGNWTQFVLTELVQLWPACSNLRLQAELGSTHDPAKGGRGRAAQVNDTVHSMTRDALTKVLGLLHGCGASNPALEGNLPLRDDIDGWVELYLKASQNLRNMLGSGSISPLRGKCALAADKDSRVAILEINLQALEELSGERGEGFGRLDIAREIEIAHAAVAAVKAEPSSLHCREVAAHKRAVLDHLWEDYQFGPLIAEAYPLDTCSLDGLTSFIEYHTGNNGELLERKAEPDHSMLKAVRGFAALQRAVLRPASLDSGHWLIALDDVQNAVWKGIAFPDLHEAAGKLMAELANAGMLPELIAVALEHPPLEGAGQGGSRLRHGRAPGDVQPARTGTFGGLDVPGYSLLPIKRFEEKAINLWGDEEHEENWDPVRLGLSYLDLVPACEMPLQVATCFLSAALWFWSALELLGDRRGGDAWLENYINEDLFSVSPESKRLAMQYGLKRAILELTEYATNMADHNLLPGARLSVQRQAYLILLKVTDRFGTEEDAPRMLAQIRSFINSARLNPFWSPPITQVSDAVFVDILGQRLSSSFLDGLYESSGLQQGQPEKGGEIVAVVPSAVLEYCRYEACLLGAGEVDVVTARFEVMGALLQDTDRQWEDIEAILKPGRMPLDMAGFVAGDRPAWPAPGTSRHTGGDDEFVAVRGIRMNLQTGHASVIVARPQGNAFPIIARSDLAAVLGINELDPLYLSLDQPSSTNGQKQFPHHPFQKAVIGLNGLDKRLEMTLLHAALTVQQIVTGTEVSSHAPFPTKSCADGLCRGLPDEAQAKLRPLGGVPGEPWDVPARLMLECNSVPYWQRFAEDSSLEVMFGEPVIELNPGKQLRQLDEEAFKSWSVEKLQNALRSILSTQERQEDNSALEKHELVEALLRALDTGRYLEDEEEAGNNLAKFSRRFTHHLPGIIDRWPQIGRLKPLCALRAAGLILRNQLEQQNETAKQQRASIEESGDSHVQSLKEQAAKNWRAALSEIHQNVLGELGFVDLDPGMCFGDGQTRNFGMCCSVGDNAGQCWPEGEPSAGGSPSAERQRCCGPDSRRTGFNMQLVAAVAAQLGSVSPRKPAPDVLMPAVSAWLHDPTGLVDGATLSGKVIDLLAEEVKEETVLKNHDDQLQKPIDQFAAELKALKPLELGKLSSNDGKETWLPVPTIQATGGRRTLYTTVAFTPQLVQLNDAEAEAEDRRNVGPLEIIPLEDLVKLSGRSGDESAVDAQYRVLQKTSELMRILDSRVGVTHLGDLTEAGQTNEDADFECSVDGWRELDVGKASSTLGFGDRLRIRQRMAEDVQGQEGFVKNIMAITEAPGDTALVWEVALGEDGLSRYLDFNDHTIVVSVPCGNEIASEAKPTPYNASSAEEVGADLGVWPACVESNMASPSSSGMGLFVNLGAFGISEGCFMGDCSHSDHFSAKSPAECARTCRRIVSCRLWTFREATPSTCWLRLNATFLEDAPGAVSANASCVPPVDDATSFEKLAKPTLFKLVSGSTGTPPPNFWEEWDMVGVLQDFGHMTLEELQKARTSARQRTALRVAARATSKCGDSWRGCASS